MSIKVWLLLNRMGQVKSVWSREDLAVAERDRIAQTNKNAARWIIQDWVINP